jgi:TM2 domain-containing membrane protein YozV
MSADSSKTDEVLDRSWLTALMLSIFLGSLGIDRFYMGHIGLGILKLFLAGGFGVWWLIDLILIAARHNFTRVNWVD